MSSRGPFVSSRSSLRNRARPRRPSPMSANSWREPCGHVDESRSLGHASPGTVDVDAAAWLTPFLVGQRATKTMRRLARELAAEADHSGTALPSPALNGTSGDCASAQDVATETMSLAA